MKLQPHSELPYAEGEEFTVVMSLDRGAGVRPVVQQRCRKTSRNVPMKNLVAPSAPTADDREEHAASGHAVSRTWCRDLRWANVDASATSKIETISCRRRQELRSVLASVIVITGLARPLCQRKVQMRTRLLNSRTVCLAVALQRFSSGRKEAAVPVLKTVRSDSVEIGRCECQD